MSCTQLWGAYSQIYGVFIFRVCICCARYCSVTCLTTHRQKNKYAKWNPCLLILDYVWGTGYLNSTRLLQSTVCSAAFLRTVFTFVDGVRNSGYISIIMPVFILVASHQIHEKLLKWAVKVEGRNKHSGSALKFPSRLLFGAASTTKRSRRFVLWLLLNLMACGCPSD